MCSSKKRMVEAKKKDFFGGEKGVGGDWVFFFLFVCLFWFVFALGLLLLFFKRRRKTKPEDNRKTMNT